jgi:hypothetical protein
MKDRDKEQTTTRAVSCGCLLRVYFCRELIPSLLVEQGLPVFAFVPPPLLFDLVLQ